MVKKRYPNVIIVAIGQVANNGPQGIERELVFGPPLTPRGADNVIPS